MSDSQTLQTSSYISLRETVDSSLGLTQSSPQYIQVPSHVISSPTFPYPRERGHLPVILSYSVRKAIARQTPDPSQPLFCLCSEIFDKLEEGV